MELAIFAGYSSTERIGVGKLSRLIKRQKRSLTCYGTYLKLPQVCVVFGELVDFSL